MHFDLAFWYFVASILFSIAFGFGLTWYTDRRVSLRWTEWWLPRDDTGVSTTRFRLWNAGRATLAGALAAKADPPRLIVSDGNLVAAVVTATTRPAIGFACEVDRGEVLLTFDYLDPRDGAVIEVRHVGGSVWYGGAFQGVAAARYAPINPARESPEPNVLRRLLRLQDDYIIVVQTLLFPFVFHDYIVWSPLLYGLAVLNVITAIFGVWYHRGPRFPPALTLIRRGEWPGKRSR